jgi:hypothetical protein
VLPSDTSCLFEPTTVVHQFGGGSNSNQRSIAKAKAALNAAKQEHETKVAANENECALVDERARAEDDRRRPRRDQLKTAQRKAVD